MKRYTIQLRETCVEYRTVKANSEAEAEEIGWRMIHDDATLEFDEVYSHDVKIVQAKDQQTE